MTDASDPGADALATSLVIGVSGHRTLRAADLASLRSQVRSVLLGLRARYPLLPLAVLSPLAEGADRLVADVAFDLGLRVIAPLPMPVDLYRDDFGTAESLACFDAQCARAVVLPLPLARGNTRHTVRIPGPSRDRQYAEAGMFVSRHCHVLLALWDGHDRDAVGGTSHVVRFHLHGALAGQHGQRRAALSLLGLNENTLVRHIAAARGTDSDDARSDGPWLTAQDVIEAHDAIPDGFHRMFRKQATFNGDLANYAAPIAALPIARPTGIATDECLARSCPIEHLFVGAEWLARTYQRRVMQVLRAIYLIAAATGAAFLLYSPRPPWDAIIYVYLLLFASGVGLSMLASRRDWHRKHLDYRALAEGLRIESYWRRAGVVDLARPSTANENFMQEQDADLGWIRNVLRAASLEGLLVPAQGAHDPARAGDTAAGDAASVAVKAVIDDWIGTPQTSGQRHYFSVTSARRARQHRQAERLALGCLSVGIGISVLLALFAQRWSSDLRSSLVNVMGLLSMAAGVHEAYAYKKADKELVKQYRFMERIFGGARRRLDAATDVAEQRDILRVLGEAALAEHAEWTLMHRERPLEHRRLGS